jgi:hypothetical protein
LEFALVTPAGTLITTSWSGGYQVRIRVNGQSSGVVSVYDPLVYSNVRFRVHSFPLSSGALLFVVSLENLKAVVQNIDVEVRFRAIMLQATESGIFQGPHIVSGGLNVPFWRIKPDIGFTLYSETYSCSWVLKNYPLIRSASTYWFGLYTDLGSQVWNQGELEGLSDVDTAAAWSWQGIALPPGGLVTVASLVRSGNFEEIAPIVTLSKSSLPRTVGMEDRFTISGRVSSDKKSSVITVFYMIGNNHLTLQTLIGGLDPGFQFSGVIDCRSSMVVVGEQGFVFYAVDNDGCVSDPEPWTIRVQGPIRTTVAERTRTPVPSPSPLGYSFGLRAVCDSMRMGVDGVDGSLSVTSAHGWTIRMRVDGLISEEMSWCGCLVHSNVTLTPVFRELGREAVVIAFRLVNDGISIQTVDVGIDGNGMIDKDDRSGFGEIGGDRGFIEYSGNYAFAFILRDYPLVHDVSTYWYGASSARWTNIWNEVSEIGLGDDEDTGFAFSWQGIRIEAGEMITISAIVRSGTSIDVSPRLVIGGFPGYIIASEAMNVSGSVSHPNLEAEITLCVVIDGNVSLIVILAEHLFVPVSGAELPRGLFRCEFQPSAFGVLPGIHDFTFYAFDGNGSISRGAHFSVTLKGISVRADWSKGDFGFNVWGLAGSHTVGMTNGNNGFQVRLRTNGAGTSSGYMQGQQGLVHNEVTLTTHLTQLGDSGVFICLKMHNNGGSQKSMDVECHATVLIDGTEKIACTVISNPHGFYVGGDIYGFLVICGRYPLTTSVSDFWTGSPSLATTNCWGGGATTFEGSAACSWMWRNQPIPAHGFVTRGVVIRSSKYDVIRPELVLIGANTNISLYPSDSLNVSGWISNSVESDLMMVIDTDLSRIVTICERIVSNYSIEIAVSDYGLGIGEHQLSFHGVDRAYGRVSEGRMIGLTIIDPASLIRISWKPVESGFEIFGTNSSEHVIETTGGRGYAPIMQIGGETTSRSAVQRGGRLGHRGVDLVMNFTVIGEYAILIVFEMRNGNTASENVNVACEGDLLVDGQEKATCSQVSGSRGFHMQGTRYGFTVIGRRYGFVSDTASYWYGAASGVSGKYWTEGGTAQYSEDSGCTWSWSKVSIAGKGSATVGLVMRSGKFIEGVPEVSMPKSAIPTMIMATHSLHLSGTVTDMRMFTSLELWLIVDDNLSNIQILMNRSGPGRFEYDLELKGYNLDSGQHSFSFHAVDRSLGRISSAARYLTTIHRVVNASGVIPIWFCEGEQFNFDIYGNTSDGLIVGSTSYGIGYATRLQVDGIDSTTSCPYEGSLELLGLTLTTHLTRLGEYAILIGFKVVNGNSVMKSVSIECDSDIAPDGEEQSICRDLGGSRGFYFREGDTYGFTLIGRGYPLVRNVTGYWFGPRGKWISNYWGNIGSGTELSNIDAACSWSWQNIEILAGEFVTVSVIMRSGQFAEYAPELWMPADMIPFRMGPYETVDVNGWVRTFNWPALMDLLFVVDDDASAIHRLLSRVEAGSFGLVIQLPLSGIRAGVHRLAFYGMDIPEGRVSEGVFYSVDIMKEATVTDTPFPTPTISPLGTASTLFMMSDGFEKTSALTISTGIVLSDTLWTSSHAIGLSDFLLASPEGVISQFCAVSDSIVATDDDRQTFDTLVTSGLDWSEECSGSNSLDSDRFPLTLVFLASELFSSGAVIEGTLDSVSSAWIEGSRDYLYLSDCPIETFVNPSLELISSSYEATSSLISSILFEVSIGSCGFSEFSLGSEQIQDSGILPISIPLHLTNGDEPTSICLMTSAFRVSEQSSQSETVGESDQFASTWSLLASTLLLSGVIVEETLNHMSSNSIVESGDDRFVTVGVADSLACDSLEMLSLSYDCTSPLMSSPRLSISGELCEFSQFRVTSEQNLDSGFLSISSWLLSTTGGGPTLMVNASRGSSGSETIGVSPLLSSGSIEVSGDCMDLSEVVIETMMSHSLALISSSLISSISRRSEQILDSDFLDISPEDQQETSTRVMTSPFVPSMTHRHEVEVEDSSVSISCCNRTPVNVSDESFSWIPSTSVLTNSKSVISTNDPGLTQIPLINSAFGSSDKWSNSDFVECDHFSLTDIVLASGWLSSGLMKERTLNLARSEPLEVSGDCGYLSEAAVIETLMSRSLELISSSYESTSSLMRSIFCEVSEEACDSSSGVIIERTFDFSPSGQVGVSLHCGNLSGVVIETMMSHSLALISSSLISSISLRSEQILDSDFLDISTEDQQETSTRVMTSPFVPSSAHHRQVGDSTRSWIPSALVLVGWSSVVSTNDADGTGIPLVNSAFISSQKRSISAFHSTASLQHSCVFSLSHPMDIVTLRHRSLLPVDITRPLPSASIFLAPTMLGFFSPLFDSLPLMSRSAYFNSFIVASSTASVSVPNLMFSQVGFPDLSSVGHSSEMPRSTDLPNDSELTRARILSAYLMAGTLYEGEKAVGVGLIGGIVGGVIALCAIAITLVILKLRHEEEEAEDEEEEDHEANVELQFETSFQRINGRNANETLYDRRSSFSLAVQSFAIPNNPQAILDFNPEEYFV